MPCSYKLLPMGAHTISSTFYMHWERSINRTNIFYWAQDHSHVIVRDAHRELPCPFPFPMRLIPCQPGDSATKTSRRCCGNSLPARERLATPVLTCFTFPTLPPPTFRAHPPS